MTSPNSLIEAIARAIKTETGCFRDPVGHYVEGEALSRWEKDNPDCDAPDGIEWDLESWRIIARTALEAIEQAGFVVVPAEPTEEMLAGGRRFAVPATQSISAIYAALLAARPRVT